jgi:hypothetical protein
VILNLEEDKRTRKILTLVQTKKKKKEEEKKSIYQTGVRDRIELAVRCEH